MLELRGLHVDYSHFEVIKGLSLSVAANEVVALLGINGAGKTTLLHSIIGFVPSRRGTIALLGKELTGLQPHAISRAGVALIPQGRRVFPSLTVKENLVIARRSSQATRWDIERVLELFPTLQHRLGHQGRELSGGEQQMLAWARALLTDPALLLMDEPTEGLSPLLVRSLQELIVRMKAERMTMLLAEQNIEFACAVADRVAVLVNGKIAEEFDAGQLGQLRGEEAVARLAAVVQGLSAR